MSNRQQNKPFQAFKIERASESSIKKVKALIIGESGAGKSHLIATAPKPLVILTEPNGAVSVASSNPDALIVRCQSLHDVRNIITVLYKGSFNSWNDNDDPAIKELWESIEGKFETLCIDSITELQNLIQEDMIEAKVAAGGKREFKGFDMYGELLERSTRAIKQFMKLPYHFVCTALAEAKEDDDKVRHMYPMLTGSIRNTINSLFSGVGYLYQNGQKDDQGYSQRSLLLDGHDRIKSKAFPNTHGIIVDPNITTLFESVLQITFDNEPEPEPEPPKPKRRRTRKKKEPAPTMDDLKELGLVDEDGHIDEPQRLRLGGVR